MASQVDAVLLIVLGLLLAGPADPSRVHQRRPPKSGSFFWNNCDRAKDPVLFRSLSLLPDPVLFPGNMTFGFEVRTSVPLNDPQKVEIIVEKELAGFWVKVPCVEELGSCTYEDICQVLDTFIPPGQPCPEPLHTYGLPCHCPIKAGIYSLPRTEFILPNMELPSWLSFGHYRIQGILSSGGKRLGCVKISASLMGK